LIKKRVEYYDTETGELLDERMLEVKDLAVRFKVGSSGANRSSRFSKVFQMQDPNFKVSSYYRYFFKCLLHLEMSTNRIVNFTNGFKEPNIPLNENDLVKLFDTSLKTTRNFIKYCKDKDIIAKISKNDELYGYMVNPIYALNGSKISSMLYTIFRNSNLDEHIPKQDLIKLHEYLKVRPKDMENNFQYN